MNSNNGVARRVRGMRDLRGSELFNIESVTGGLEEVINRNNFEYVDLPIVEMVDIYLKSAGNGPESLPKHIYYVNDDKTQCLRPEGTAGAMRAYLSEPQDIKRDRICYFGSMFRKERPQSLRYREFFQYGFEVYGRDSVISDIEMICLLEDVRRRFSADNMEIRINYLGTRQEMGAYSKAIDAQFSVLSSLTETQIQTLESNPLRVLDLKDPIDADCPPIQEYVNQDRFSFIKSTLDSLGIKYTVDESLVRGLDYYNGIVFEMVDKESEVAVAGGGRYDDLAQMMGSKVPVPAIGMAIGIDRFAYCLNLGSKTYSDLNELDIMILPMFGSENEDKIIQQAFNVQSVLKRFYSTMICDSTTKLAKRLKRASALDVYKAIIIGDNEIEGDYLTVKNLEKRTQEEVPVEKLPESI